MERHARPSTHTPLCSNSHLLHSTIALSPRYTPLCTCAHTHAVYPMQRFGLGVQIRDYGQCWDYTVLSSPASTVYTEEPLTLSYTAVVLHTFTRTNTERDRVDFSWYSILNPKLAPAKMSFHPRIFINFLLSKSSRFLFLLVPFFFLSRLDTQHNPEVISTTMPARRITHINRSHLSNTSFLSHISCIGHFPWTRLVSPPTETQDKV